MVSRFNQALSTCARIEKIQNSELVTSIKWQSLGLVVPKKWQSPELWLVWRVSSSELSRFGGWQVLDSVISEGGQFSTRFFLHSGTIGGKNRRTACMPK